MLHAAAAVRPPMRLGLRPRSLSSSLTVDVAERARRVEFGLAAATLAFIGIRQTIHTQITSGYVLALLLMPLWVRCIRRYRGARAFLGFGLLVTVWGVAMPKLGDSTHLMSSINRNNSLALMLGTLASIGVVLWARTLMRPTTVSVCFGVGMLLGGVAGFTSPGGNAWKFVYAVPVALVTLALAAASRRRWLQIATLLVLMLVSVMHDSRSYLATFLLVSVLLMWQWRPTRLGSRASWVVNAIGLGAMAWAVYYLGTTLLLSGYLGRAAQARSIQQIDQSGSLLLGGRPELAGTWALMKHQPWGFGTGVLPNMSDVMAAKQGMFSIGYAPNNGYVDRFMFGDGIELHSTFGDLWATFGIPGLVLAGVVAFLSVRGIARSLAERNASPVLLFLCVWTLWNVAFSPLLAATPTLILAIGFVLAPRDGDGTPPVGYAGRRYSRRLNPAEPVSSPA